MDELIQELAMQANDKTGNLFDLNHKELNVFLEKFAELLVLECAKVLTQHGSYFSGEGEPYHYAASLIEEHFGVEK